MPEQYIQVIIRNDTVTAFLEYDDNNHLLAKGEPAAVWEVRIGPDGTPLFAADGVTPLSGHLLYQVIGDGYTRFSQLVSLWPVRKASFNSVVSQREGAGRNLEDITQTNATHRYQTFDEAVDNFYHPYAKPQITSFTPSGFADREIGQPLPRNFSFGWSASPAQNVQPGSLSIQQTFAGSTTTLASGLNPGGSFTPSGLAPLVGTSLGQTATFTLNGSNTRGGAMEPVSRTAQWLGRRALFLHPDTQWLVPGMSAKAGDPAGSYVSDEATVVALINNALDSGDSALGNSSFGLRTLDGGVNGKRAYVAYPKAYRTSARFIDPNFNVDQGVVFSRELTVSRNGVPVVYVLLGLDLRIVQQLSSYVQ